MSLEGLGWKRLKDNTLSGIQLSGLMGLVDMNKTRVHLTIKLTNEHRVPAGVERCDLIVDPGGYEKVCSMPLPADRPIEYGHPTTIDAVFTLDNTSERSLIRKSYRVAVTDGTGNVERSRVVTFVLGYLQQRVKGTV